MDEFYNNALEELKAAMQCIYNYLLAAGATMNCWNYMGKGCPQKANQHVLEVIPTDPLLLDWSITQFGIFFIEQQI